MLTHTTQIYSNVQAPVTASRPIQQAVKADQWSEFQVERGVTAGGSQHSTRGVCQVCDRPSSSN